MITMNRLIYLFAGTMLFSVEGIKAQVFKLSIAESRAMEHYPMIKQKGLIESTANLTVDNFAKGYLPQLSVGGQATSQSDVTRITIPNAPFVVEPLSRNQFKLNLDINQLIYDGGLIKNQRELATLQSKLEDSRLEVELFKLRERIDQLYCSILYLDAMIAQVADIRNDISNGISKVTAQFEGGTAFRSSLNVLKAEELKVIQRKIELESSRLGMLQIMSILTDTVLDEHIQFEVPLLTAVEENKILRPEMEVFNSQFEINKKQLGLVRSKTAPKASAFIQGGYGRPGLNMLKNEFDWYGIGGIRFNWGIGNFYTASNEKKIATNAMRSVQLQQETFVKNTNAQLTQQRTEIVKFKQLIASDKEIIALREAVKLSAAAQLEAGVITSSDYLREVNAEDQSRQNLKAHEVQLIQAQIQLKLITGIK